jgi:hypothetical protein
MTDQQIVLTVEDIGLLIEALTMSVGRHEATSRRHYPHLVAGPHDRKAERMRQLRQKLLRRKVGVRDAQSLLAKLNDADDEHFADWQTFALMIVHPILAENGYRAHVLKMDRDVVRFTVEKKHES